MEHSKMIVILFLLLYNSIYSIDPIDNLYLNNNNSAKFSRILLEKGNSLYETRNYTEAITIYESLLTQKSNKKSFLLKRSALSYAAQGDAEKSALYIEKYLLEKFDTSFLLDDGFDNIKNSKPYIAIVNKYSPKIGIWSFLYLYVALIGFFVSIVINFNKKIDKTAKILISSFIFIHSVFIFHICLNITNYQYEFPHSYLMSTSFSFLYGPLLYFYYKRIIQEYQFKKADILHLFPTFLFLIYIIPIYGMSANEKLNLMLDTGNISNGYITTDTLAITIIVSLKLLSLIIYGYFIRNLYLTSKRSELGVENKSWQRNIYRIHFLYILSYAFYGVLVSNNLHSGFFYHLQIISMSLMVIYVGYWANVQPSVFNGLYPKADNPFFKYKKSALTNSFSEELKENLIILFDQEKIYRNSDLNLEILAKELNTTRHNTSQVINEHFKISFHELVNKYRIMEAKEILDNNFRKDLNIIDIAYEVGYNNKVTFNKAFKKNTQLTPSQYQKIAINA